MRLCCGKKPLILWYICMHDSHNNMHVCFCVHKSCMHQLYVNAYYVCVCILLLFHYTYIYFMYRFRFPLIFVVYINISFTIVCKSTVHVRNSMDENIMYIATVCIHDYITVHIHVPHVIMSSYTLCACPYLHP